MTYRSLQLARAGDVDAFYLTALRYGQDLWLRGHAGRAILAVTRALYADLPEGAAILRDWPLPYRPLYWIVQHHPSADFPGNPRVSFQHQATRLRGERAALRRARAWAVWALVCEAKPGLRGDVAQGIEEPTTETICEGLDLHGHAGEVALWRAASEA